MDEKVEKYQRVVISGGGSNGILSLGALHYEYQKGTYDPSQVQIYAGTSIGSVISLLLICGYLPMEIFAQVYTLNHFFDLNKCGSIWDIVRYMGLMSIDVFVDRIEEMVLNKLGKVPTLEELRSITNKTLVVAVSNVTKVKCEYLTYKTRPNMSCVDAVIQSCNLPIIFHSIFYEGSWIVDGGLVDNFPLRYIDDGSSKILGIVTTGIDKSLPDNKFIGYFYRILMMPVYSNTKLRCELAKENTKIIKIVRNKSSLKLFSISCDDKMRMFWDGYYEAYIQDHSTYIHVKGW
jgi:predicted acylesterase/phospholipase RssA